MLSKRYESTEVDRRTWLHVPSGTHWSTSSGTHQVVEIQIETSSKMYNNVFYNTSVADWPRTVTGRDMSYLHLSFPLKVEIT